MKRVKKPKKKNQKHNVSEKQLQRIKNKVTDDVTKKALLLFLSAASDEIGLTDEQACDIFRRANRYGEYMDDHIVRIQKLQETMARSKGYIGDPDDPNLIPCNKNCESCICCIEVAEDGSREHVEIGRY